MIGALIIAMEDLADSYREQALIDQERAAVVHGPTAYAQQTRAMAWRTARASVDRWLEACAALRLLYTLDDHLNEGFVSDIAATRRVSVHPAGSFGAMQLICITPAQVRILELLEKIVLTSAPYRDVYDLERETWLRDRALDVLRPSSSTPHGVSVVTRER